jgi:hypothetical protein
MTKQFLAITNGLYREWGWGETKEQAIYRMKVGRDFPEEEFTVYEVHPSYLAHVNDSGVVCGHLREGHTDPKERWYWVAP